MKPLLLPLAEHLGRVLLRRRGIASSHVGTQLGPVHTYDARGTGDLPPTVLLHGLGSAATPFGPVLERLLPHVQRVVAPDYPGHGFSDGGDDPLTAERLFDTVTMTLAATTKTEPVILVGNSLGGALALRYALAHPRRVRALVLLSPAGARASDAEWRAIRAAFDVTTRAQACRFLERIYHRPPWFFPLFAHEVPHNLARRPVRDLLENASNDDFPHPEALSLLTMPILFCWGRSERLLPLTHLDYFMRHLPKHAVIEQPEGIGHCPHIDAPGRLAHRIVTFARANVL